MTRIRFSDGWAPGPLLPLVDREEVHLWRIPLAPVATPDVAAWLRVDEHARAAKLLRPGDGPRWERSRAGLRGILGRYLGIHPASVEFARGPGGKPGVRGSALRFNLTHSHELALCAVATREVGVDVERLRAAPMPAGVAAGIVSDAGPIFPGEAQTAELDVVFFTAWTRVEAALKATGEGLPALDRRPDTWVRRLAAGGQFELDGQGFLIADLPVDEGYIAALALIPEIGSAQNPIVVRCWSWGFGSGEPAAR